MKILCDSLLYLSSLAYIMVGIFLHLSTCSYLIVFLSVVATGS